MQEDHVQEDHVAWYLSGDKLTKFWEVFSFSNLFTTVFHVGGKWDYRKNVSIIYIPSGKW